MKKSKVNIEISLDEENIPEKIQWMADDHPSDLPQDSKAISLSFWDGDKKDTLSLDLWTKDMDVMEMKKFYINLLGSASNTILNATGDEFMSTEIANLCEKFGRISKKELNSAST